MTLPVDQQLGDYRILEPIGVGGMGEVYLAEHVHLRKQYAVKVLPRALAGDPNFVQRFFDEARVMAELRHPHIVQVHHMGRARPVGEGPTAPSDASSHADYAAGVYFLAMDYVTGPDGKPESLHDRLKDKRHAPDGRLPEADVRRWALQVAEALAYAHERGVVHRDLKPANILLDANGNAVLTDFGLAKAIGREFILSQIHQTIQHSLGSLATLKESAAPVGDMLDAAATVTEGDSGGSRGSAGSGKRSSGASSILGTYDYMAPEQRGEGTGEIGPWTDIYSFGIVLYRLLTGRRPTAFAQPPSTVVSGLSKAWDTIVARCMQDDPQRRYASAAELLGVLRGMRRVSATPARWLIGVAVVALAVAAGVLYWPSDGGRTPTAPEPDSLPAVRATETTAEGSADRAESSGSTKAESVGSPATSHEAHDARLKAALAVQDIMRLSDHQGFSDRKQEIVTLFNDAETLYYNEALGESHKLYRRVQELCGSLQKSEAERQDALNARLTWAAAQARIPDTLFQDIINQVELVQQREAQAQHDFESGDFVSATRLWRTCADDLIELIRRHDVVKQSAEKQREAWRVATRAKPRKLCNVQGIQEAVERAERAASSAEEFFGAGQYPAAERAWEDANASLLQALETHDQHVRTILDEAATKERSGAYQEAATLLEGLADCHDVHQRRVDLCLAWVRSSLQRRARHQARAGLDELRKVAPNHDQLEGLEAQVDAVSPPVYTDWPFDKTEAARRQQETASFLGIPVDTTLELGSGVTLELVLVPAGILAMGTSMSPSELARRYGGESKHFEDEHVRLDATIQLSAPQGLEVGFFEVRITEPYYIGRTEVTRAQFELFVSETGYVSDAERGGQPIEGGKKGGRTLTPEGKVDWRDDVYWQRPGFDQAARHPVVLVSWNDAQAFISWLNEKNIQLGSKLVFRLPTEAEWEMAARAGTSTEFWWGNELEFTGKRENVFDRGHGRSNPPNMTMPCDDGYATTSPVATYGPNHYGLHDMLGNVAEWCDDWYGAYTATWIIGRKGIRIKAENPRGPTEGKLRVVRGGHWFANVHACRSSWRWAADEQSRAGFLGFRIAASVE